MHTSHSYMLESSDRPETRKKRREWQCGRPGLSSRSQNTYPAVGTQVAFAASRVARLQVPCVRAESTHVPGNRKGSGMWFA